MKKVVVLWSSPNTDGLTASAKDQIAKGLIDAGTEVEEIHLNKLHLEHCRACGNGWGTCNKNGTCLIKDDFADIYKKIKEADGIVWVSAVYWSDIKECGGLPFLTDCNTLYPGSRKHALEHLDCANINGFNTITTGCQIIIADGLRGTDDIVVPVPNGEYCKEAYIGRAVMDADIFISLNHFKGHEMAGFGGAIKNIGMGCESRAGKMHQHNSGQPHVNEAMCRGCRRCAKECGSDAISYNGNKAWIDPAKCKGCGRCIGACAFDAIANNNWDAAQQLGRKMAEYTAAVVSGRPNFHISLITDVSPNCDCHGENDAPILPDIGMLASFDPVALDQACVDLCQKAEPIRNSQLGDNMASEHFHDHGDVWHNSNPNVSWAETLEHAEKIGVGTRQYELITGV